MAASADPTATFLLFLLFLLASNAIFFVHNFETVVDFFIFAVNTSATAFVSYLAWILTISVTENGTLAILNTLGSILYFLHSVVKLFQRDVISDTHRPPVELTSPSSNNYPTTTTATSSTPLLLSDLNSRVYVDYRLNERYFGQNKLTNKLADFPTWREILD
ncbi:hypothetical protein RUND412_008496 [Rhizina undulata]